MGAREKRAPRGTDGQTDRQQKGTDAMASHHRALAATTGVRCSSANLLAARGSATRGRRFAPAARAYKVEITHDGKTTQVDVDEDEYILDAVENAGIDVTYDCRMGVCMTCPAKLCSGEVDQSEGMISDDVAEKGFVLMCVAKCQSDCTIETCTEEELLDEQLMTSDA